MYQRKAIAWLELSLATCVVSLIVQLAWPTLVAWHNRPRPGVQVAGQFEGINYLLYLPELYDRKHTPWPLLLFLHGSGARGWDVQKLRQATLPALIEQGKHISAIVLSPQCPPESSWQPEQLLSLIDHMEQRFKINRIVVTGYSMGGYGTWRLAQEVPKRLAAIAPLCGGGDTSRCDLLKELPIWTFHGADDQAVLLSQSQEMIDAIKSAGGTPKLTIYPDEGHDIARMTYSNPSLFKWLLSQMPEELP